MRWLLLGLLMSSAGCLGGLELVGEGDDAGPEAPADAADAPADRPVDAADPDTPDPPCPPLVGAGETVVTAMITTDPEHFIDHELVVVGTLTTMRNYMCNDLGPCGTCYPGLALDGVMPLFGPESGGEFCGEPVGCHERDDSCLPRWDCHPFDLGRRVRVRGTWQRIADYPWETTLDELLGNYRLVVSAMEPTDPVAGVGLFSGTLTVTYSDDPAVELPFSAPFELVLAYGSEGYVAELMDPATGLSPARVVAPGWHRGPAPAEPDELVLEADLGPGHLTLSRRGTGYGGSYVHSDGEPLRRVESTLALDWVD